MCSRWIAPSFPILSFRRHLLSIPRCCVLSTPFNSVPAPRIPRRTSSHSAHDTPRLIVTHRSTSTTLVLALAATSIGGAIFVFQYLYPPNNDTQDIDIDKTDEREEQAIMVGAPLPGRPGNLTPEQEAKLKEFWTALLHVFGVQGISNGANGTVNPTEGPQGLKDAEQKSRTDAGGSEKKKKKRGSMFSRKKEDDESNNDTDTDGVSVADGEDKYGQTQEYQKVIETQSPEDLRSAFWSMVKHDDPDALLLRFLRARKWNVQNALVMLVATMHWRAHEMHVDDDIMRRGEAGALDDSKSSDPAVKKEGVDFLAQMRVGKSFLHGTDNEGRPICMVRVVLHRKGEQSETSLERYTVYTIETARLLLSGNVDTAAILFDMTDFSLANMEYAPVRFMIKCFEANYPESLGVVLVHKAPWIFQGIYKIIKNWLDPVVAAKIHFTKTPAELSAFIPLAHIPLSLGGTENFSYAYTEPFPGENDSLTDANATTTRDELLKEREEQIRAYEAATIRWVSGPEGKVGREEGERGRLVGELGGGYWALDPFLRARSWYDRVGMIGEGGVVRFYGGEGEGKGKGKVGEGPIEPGHRPEELD